MFNLSTKGQALHVIMMHESIKKTSIIPVFEESYLSLDWFWLQVWYNEYLAWISKKLNVKHISMSNKNELRNKTDQKSTWHLYIWKALNKIVWIQRFPDIQIELKSY